MLLTIFHFKTTRNRKQLIKPIVESSNNFEADKRSMLKINNGFQYMPDSYNKINCPIKIKFWIFVKSQNESKYSKYFDQEYRDHSFYFPYYYVSSISTSRNPICRTHLRLSRTFWYPNNVAVFYRIPARTLNEIIPCLFFGCVM